ncbi:sulfatase-like hydrolase/transferase [Chitinophaga sp. HK235]|uniref:sulfatase-like hydrolase/transferase n=1 Tax=Chitinophaga sp. HK235 TaxID=2952571 RepID=UPI001BAB52EE|nr:sulfatase-like hydrolase/transferase [Chitinophaga sp. HK235]
MKKTLWWLLPVLMAFQVSAQQRKPNVIFILSDDMGYGDASCYGSPQIRTPELDRLAREGFRSTGFMVSAPSCTPSRASLLTGRYPDKVNMPYAVAPGDAHALSDSIFTLARMFKANHYQTMMIGKWHLGDKANSRPLSHGFDHFFGMLYSHDYQSPFVNTDTTLAVFYDNNRVIEKPDYSKLMGWYTDSALAYIKRASRSQQPFFLYLPFPMPHAPLAVPSEWKGKSRGGLYGDVIEQQDACIGKIIALLRQLKLDQQTIVMFTSDNGPWNDMPDRMLQRDIVKPWDHGSTGPFRGGKANTYEGGHREPFIAWAPGRIAAGTVADQPFIINDILPTLAAATSYTQPLPVNVEGVNVWQHIIGRQTQLPERPLFYLSAIGKLEAVRKGDWKLRIATTEKGKTPVMELYNLRMDISEKHNVATKYPEITASLKQLLDNY